MTEKDMQKYIANSHIAKRWFAIIPNCYSLYDNECDLLAIRNSGFYDEIEIKVTKADFRNDSKKTVKLLNENSKTWRDKWIDTPKRTALQEGDTAMANYYWYAMPMGLVDHSEIPEWAGIIEVQESGWVKEVRMPKRLHSTKLTTDEQLKQTRKLHFRYWNMVNK